MNQPNRSTPPPQPPCRSPTNADKTFLKPWEQSRRRERRERRRRRRGTTARLRRPERWGPAKLGSEPERRQPVRLRWRRERWRSQPRQPPEKRLSKPLQNESVFLSSSSCSSVKGFEISEKAKKSFVLRRRSRVSVVSAYIDREKERRVSRFGQVGQVGQLPV